MKQIFMLACMLGLFWGVVTTPAQEEDVSSNKDAGTTLLISERFVETPIQAVVERLSEITGKTITLGKNVSGNVTVVIKNLYWTKALRVVARKIDGFVVEHGPDWIEITRPPLVTFATDPAGTDIRAVLDAIALNYGFNLVMSNRVTGTVHLRLTRVPWRKAVEVAVKAAGNYAVVDEDYDIIRIVPALELATQLETRVFPLKYITSPSSVQATMTSSYADVTEPTETFTLQTALQNVITPDLGFIEFDSANRAFIIKDTKLVLDEVENIIELMDVPEEQVMVEVYVVSTSRTDFVDLGVDWGSTGPTVQIGGGSMLHRLPFQLGDGGFEDAIGLGTQTPTSSIIAAGLETFESNKLPIPNPVTDFTNNGNGTSTAVGTFTAGSLDFTGLSAILKFVETDSESKVVQSPKLTVMDNHRATIFSGDEIRYAESEQVSAQDGSLNLIFSEAEGSPVNVGFQLFLTPHVVPGTDKIILDVIPESNLLTGTTSALAGFESFGSGSTAIDLPRISSQTVVTKIAVESGQTAMIGGLVSYNDVKTDNRVPILGDIPILNFLFRNKSRTKTVTNLTVFIRPTIVKDMLASREEMARDLERRRERARREYSNRINTGSNENE